MQRGTTPKNINMTLSIYNLRCLTFLFSFSYSKVSNQYARQILPDIDCVIACSLPDWIGADGLLYDRKAFYQRRNNGDRCSGELVANGPGKLDVRQMDWIWHANVPRI